MYIYIYIYLCVCVCFCLCVRVCVATHSLGHTGPVTGSIYLYLLTYSKMQSPSREANWFAASQEIPSISRNLKVHYRIHKRPLPVSILGQPNPVHIPTPYLLEIHPNIIHPSTLRSPQWSSTHQDPIHHPLLIHTRHMPSSSHSSRFYHPHNIGWGVQISSFLVMQSPPFPHYLVPPSSKYSPLHHVLKQPQLPFLPQRPCFTPIQINRQNYSLYILIFKFLDSNLEDKRFCTG